MKQNKNKPVNIYKLITFIAMIIAVMIVLSSCCRPATEFQVAKWERKYKFESPRAFWGLHIRIGKKDVYKYKN